MNTMQPESNILEDQNFFMIKLDVTHSKMKMRLAELKFDRRTDIGEVKIQLERRFGSAPHNQCLELQTSSGQTLCQMLDDNQSLGAYGATSGNCIHCIDNNAASTFAEWEDVSQVEKYKISEENFDKKEGTFRKFKE